MNAKKIEKWILLEQSGELSSRRQKQLDRYPDVQRMRDELARLQAVLPDQQQDPSPWTVTKIDARLRGETGSSFNFSKHWKPALSLAAGLALAAGIWNFNTEPSTISVAEAVTEVNAWNNEFNEDLVELESLILAMSGDPLDTMEM